VQGARAVQRAIVQGSSPADLSVSIVWVNMLPLDSIVTARFMARTMKAPCVRHFHDPGRLVGKAIAQSLGGQGELAWDMYLFYPRGIEWDDGPPAPIRWAHQLSAAWADSAYYHTGNGLIDELHNAVNQLASASEAGG